MNSEEKVKAWCREMKGLSSKVFRKSKKKKKKKKEKEKNEWKKKKGKKKKVLRKKKKKKKKKKVSKKLPLLYLKYKVYRVKWKEVKYFKANLNVKMFLKARW